jgi:hypothetical protein
MNQGQSHPPGDVIRRIQCEFLEMPGLRLTEAQARRLWGLAVSECSLVLAALVDAGFLFRTRDGSFMRIDRATPVKADLSASTPPVYRTKVSAA